MRLFFSSVFCILLTQPGFAEDLLSDPYVAQRTEPTKDTRTGEVNFNQPAQPAPVSGLPGFAEIAWKSNYSEVKTRLKNLSTAAVTTERVEILNEDKNKSILVKRNDVLYRYDFYKTPIEVVRLTNHEITQQEYDQTEAQLYHVNVNFALIKADLIRAKIEEKHGAKTKSTVDDKLMEGAEIWELTGGVVLQWVEPYRKMKFTRSVDFLSDDMAKQILKEYEDYFDAKEKWILKNILLY